MPVAIDLMDLSSVAIADAKQRVHARVGSDRDARVEGLDVPDLGKDLELDDSVAQRITDAAGVTWLSHGVHESSDKVGAVRPSLKRNGCDCRMIGA